MKASMTIRQMMQRSDKKILRIGKMDSAVSNQISRLGVVHDQDQGEINFTHDS
jgi:hypothetical protein